MNKKHEKNTDAKALESRANLNSHLAMYDLEKWLSGICSLWPGMRILDIGCGRGKQSLYLARLLDDDADIVSVDISAEALEALRRDAGALKSIKTLQHSLDECGGIDGDPFDLILSSYAIYYASDLTKLISELRGRISGAGMMFLCGFGEASNNELAEIVNRRCGRTIMKPVADFISAEQITGLEKVFSRIDVFRLYNRIIFPSADAVMEWWRNHSSYQGGMDTAVTMDVQRVIDKEGGFSLSKNVLGVRLLP